MHPRTSILQSVCHALVLVSMSSLLLFTGCKIDQEKEVASYRDILDQSASQPAQSQPADQPMTRPLSLDEALFLANQNNEQLGLKGEEFVQALIAKQRAVSNFLPTVALQPSYALHGNSPSLGALRTSDSDQRFQMPLNGSVNVFNGGRDISNVQSTEKTIAQRKDLLLDLQSSVLLNVAQVYYQVLRSERQVAVLTDSQALQRARLADVTSRFRNGLGTKLDVSQSQSQLDATSVSLTRAINDVDTGRTLLARLIGVHSITGALADTYAVPATVPDVQSFETKALAHRMDIQAAREAIDAARLNVDAAFAQYYPSVSLNAAGFMYPDLFTDASHWNALLIANIPIFTAGIIHADVRNAWSKYRQALLADVGTKREVLKSVQTAYFNLTSSRKVIQGLQSQVAAATESYDLSRKAYANGLAINLDVLAAQDALLSAQLQLASAQFDQTVFYLTLLRAAGNFDQQITAATQPTSQAATQPAD
jgi:outer membrane protein TolC